MKTFYCLFLIGFLLSTVSLPVYSQRQTDPVYMRDVTLAAEKQFARSRSGIKQYKRMEEYMLSRLGSNGEIVNTATKNFQAYEEYMRTHDAPGQRVFAHNGSWDYMGPVDIIPQNSVSIHGQGRVNEFAFHPTDENIIFCATAGGGLWKTIDKGLHWDPLTDGIPVMSTTGVAVDFNDPDIIYLLSGDGDGANSSAFGYNTFSRSSIGVFKTYDGGTIWKPTGLLFDEEDAVNTWEMHMDPENSQRIYICSSLGLYRTENGGEDWDRLHLNNIYEMEFKPGESNHIYIVDDNYIYVSDDHGDTWTDSTLIPDIVGEVGRMTIATCWSNPALVYLLASPVDTLTQADTIPDHRGFYLSADAGNNFILVSTRPNMLKSDDPMVFESQAYYDLDMVCHPTQANRVMVGTIGVWQTPDAGSNWTHDNGINSSYHADIHALQVNPLDNTLYLGCDGGVFISEDFGDSFEFRSGYLSTTQYYKLATSPFFTDHILAGAQDNGVHLRDEIEIVFDRVIYDDGMESVFHPTNPGMAISSSQFGRVFLSQDTAQTFEEILPPIDTGTVTDWTIPIALDASDDQVIYAGYKPIMKSIDQGETFFATSHDTISAHRILINNYSNPSILYAGDCSTCDEDDVNFRMYRSEDAGDTWDRIDNHLGFPDSSFITSAIQNPDDADEIWITCGRWDGNNKVFRSTNGGVTWANMTDDLPNVPVNAIAFEDNDGSPGGAVYVGTDIGIFYRNNDLNDWIFFSNNLPRVEVTDLDIDYNGGFVRAATYGRGLWESELFTECQPTIILNILNQPIGMSFTHHTSVQLFSTAHIDGYGSRVTYISEGFILLSEGFSATSKNGALFRGVKGSCEEGGIYAPVIEGKTGRE